MLRMKLFTAVPRARFDFPVYVRLLLFRRICNVVATIIQQDGNKSQKFCVVGNVLAQLLFGLLPLLCADSASILCSNAFCLHSGFYGLANLKFASMKPWASAVSA